MPSVPGQISTRGGGVDGTTTPPRCSFSGLNLFVIIIIIIYNTYITYSLSRLGGGHGNLLEYFIISSLCGSGKVLATVAIGDRSSWSSILLAK